MPDEAMGVFLAGTNRVEMIEDNRSRPTGIAAV
jgi:hypothetical protein